MAETIVNGVKINKLFGARNERRMTQQELAKELGYNDKNSYARIERGETSPTIVVANSIAKILGVQMNSIFDVGEGGEDERG